MGQSSKHSDTASTAPTADALILEWRKRWDERVAGIKELEGWSGRNMQDQATLIDTVMGMEDDVSWLLRYVRGLTTLIDLVATDNQSQDKTSEIRPGDSKGK